MTTTDAQVVDDLDHYARLVRRLLDVPVALVALIEEERAVFTGQSGLPAPMDEQRQAPLSHSVCKHVVQDGAPLIVPDAREVERLAINGAVVDLDVIGYAGWPLTNAAGATVGSLCAIDFARRDWTPDQVDILRDLAAACSVELHERERTVMTTRALAAAEQLGERSRALLALSTMLASTETLPDVASAITQVTTDELGCSQAVIWLVDDDYVARGATPVRAEAAPSSISSVPTPSEISQMSRPMRRPLDVGVDATDPVVVTLVRQEARFVPDARRDSAGPGARAFVPLVVRGHAYGVIELGWPTPRAFSDDDQQTLEALATYAAQAVHSALLLQERVDVSQVLQRAMLTSLPRHKRLDLAARYRPASDRDQVGGDWYDAILTADETAYVMIGDVTGHDIQAAATMGQLRSMLRMTTWQSGGSPARALNHLNLAVQELGVEALATGVLARIHPATAGDDHHTVRWANAGHLPPLLLANDGTSRLLTDPLGTDLMLGVYDDVTYRDNVVELAADQPVTLLLYTDGLIERREESIDDGLARLRECAAGGAGLPADAFLDHILTGLAQPDAEDDIAVLAVRFRSPDGA